MIFGVCWAKSDVVRRQARRQMHLIFRAHFQGCMKVAARIAQLPERREPLGLGVGLLKLKRLRPIRFSGSAAEKPRTDTEAADELDQLGVELDFRVVGEEF
jgi:hypothetical protein